MLSSLCAVTMLATTLASAMATPTYAEVIKRNATATTTAMAQNYLNKGTSSTTDLSYNKLLSNGSKYSFITDTTLLPTLYDNWRATSVDSWYFYGDDGSVKTGWVYDHGWYYLSTEEEGTAGLMRYGWYQDSEGSWYFLNTIHDGTFGRAVSGWQWIDGYSYYFDENCRLVVSGSTTDGYTVDNDGRWTVDGVVQYVEGKGLTTRIVYLDSNTASSVASDSTSTSDDDSSGSSNGSGDNSTSSDSGTASGDNTDSTKTDSTESDSTSEDEKDTDGDGVPDWLEEYLGTSSSSSDTDGDGISDYDEIYIIGSDPAVNDSSEDADSDGISNFDEINIYKTDPTSKDTDGDTLSDYDEIFVHHTDPLKADTDGDGISDADEIGYGFDPLVADSDGNGTPDGQESIIITASYDGESIAQPTAQIKLQAGVAATVNIERDDPITSIWMTEDVPGMLDAMYDFTVDGDIEEATLTFHFTEDESADFYPAIYYVDTENQVMTELENQVVDWQAKTVTATTNHFSGYVALNKVEQDRAWNEEILYYFETSDKLDVAFVIDESNTVSSIDANKERLQLASKVMDVLPVGSRASVSGFANYGRLYQPLTYDINIAKNSLTNIINGAADKSMTLSLAIAAGMFALEFDLSSTNLSKTIMSKAYAGEDIVMEIALDEAKEYEIGKDEITEGSEAIQDTTIETEISIATTSDAEKIVATISEATNEISSEIDAYVVEEISVADKFEVDDDILATVSDASAEGISGSKNVLAGASTGAGLIERNKKIIVMITDAKGTYFAPTVQEAIDNGVTIYTVGLGDGGSISLLESIAKQTGGSYYHSTQIDSLVSEIQKMSSEKVDTLTDSDGDGISDYYEDRIRLFTGKKLLLDKNNPDTDGDGVRDGDEIAFIASRSSGIINEDTKARYISAGASSSMQADGGSSYVSDAYHKLTSNPILPDSDYDFDTDDIDPSPMDFQLNDLLCGKIDELYQLAIKYNEIKEINDKNLNTSYEIWLVFMFIRRFNDNYIGDNWINVAKKIDNEFVQYVNEEDIELYRYFENKQTFIATQEGNVGDLYHMSATITAHIYDSGFDDEFKYGIVDEGILDNLAGWAGDLQTAMNDAIRIVGISADYELFRQTMKILIGYDEQVDNIYDGMARSFDIEDVYADIDAVNIYESILSCGDISDALEEYYKDEYKTRYTTVTRGRSKKSIKNIVGVYTNKKYINIIQWPLLEFDFTSAQSRAARDAFADFLVEERDKEDK